MAVLQEGIDHEFKRIADPAPVLGHQLVVRENALLQAGLPLAQIRQRAGVLAVRRTLLHISCVEIRDNGPHQGRRLTPNVTLPVHQQLIEKRQRLHLLRQAQIEGIGLDDPQIRPQPPPVRLAPGLLQKPGKAPGLREPIHQANVVLHAHQAQHAQGLLVGHQGRRLFPPGRSGTALQGGVHAPLLHESLKVLQPGVDPAIALLFCLVHPVQLIQDHRKGIRKGGDMRNLLSPGAQGLLHPEIRVNQQQRLHGQIVRLQIPHGVVRRHMADLREPPAAEPQIGIIVMEIRHPLPRSAAELADVVPGGAAGYQSQVHGHPGLLQLPAHGYGNVMYPRDMLQSPEGCHLQPQAHHFIDIFPLPQPQHLLVERGTGALLQLLSADELEIVHGVKGQYLPLHRKKHL